MSQTEVHCSIVYLRDQLLTSGKSINEQTQEVLDKVDSSLEQTRSYKSRFLSATIWMAYRCDFVDMNAVWEAWVPKGHASDRAMVGSSLATPNHLVEVIVIAAKA